MSPRTAAELDLLYRQLGTDLALQFAGPSGWWEDADLTVAIQPGRLAVPDDLETTTGEASAGAVPRRTASRPNKANWWRSDIRSTAPGTTS